MCRFEERKPKPEAEAPVGVRSERGNLVVALSLYTQQRMEHERLQSAGLPSWNPFTWLMIKVSGYDYLCCISMFMHSYVVFLASVSV